MINETVSFAKNGLIRQLCENGTWTTATFSEDGSFLAVVSSFCSDVHVNRRNELCVLETFVPKSKWQKVSNEVNHGFLWSKHRRGSRVSLTSVENREYLVLLDQEYNILIHSLTPSYERGDGFNSPESSCIKSIPKSLLKISQDNKTANKVEHILLVSATYNDLEREHRIVCIVDNRGLIEITFEDGKEPCICKKIQLPHSCTGEIFFERSGCILLVACTHGSIMIIDLNENIILQYFSIKKSFQEYPDNGEDLLAEEFIKFEISDDLRYIVTVDCNHKLHVIDTYITDNSFNREKGNQESLLKSKNSELLKFKKDDYTGTIDVAWGQELADFQQDLLDGDLHSGIGFFPAKEDSSFATVNENKGFKCPAEVPCLRTEINIPSWASELNVKDLLLCNNSVMVHFKATYSSIHAELSIDADESLQNILLLFDLQTQKSTIQRIPENSVIARSKSRFFPHCILANDLLSLPTFNTSQEQLFSGFIQYSGISEAEKICRSNQWNQFSIPLHSLEVGLQHRQIDTISFFLKTRDRAFSKYWTSASLPEATAMPDFSGNIDEDDPSAGLPTLKSHFSASLATSVINPSELHKAVEMLVKSIHQNSTGRHKKSFFEALLQMTIEFLNNLIRDGVEVLETIDSYSIPSQIMHEHKSKNFSLIVDIPESIAYFVECLNDIRQYITDLPSFYHRKENQNVPMERIAPKSFKSYMEKEIIVGRLSHLQESMLRNAEGFELTEVLNGSLSSIVKFGLNFAFQMLLERDLKKSITILKNLGKNEKTVLRKIVDYTLDRRLRKYLVTEFFKDSMVDIFSEQDRKDSLFLENVEVLYPCNAIEETCKSKHWLTSAENEKSPKLCCVSLRKWNEEEVISQGSYSELIFKWVQKWDCISRDKVALDAAFACKKTDNLEKLVSPKTLWAYLMDHNADKEILGWIHSFVYSEAKTTEQSSMPAFDANLISEYSSASSYVKRKIFFEFIKLGTYTVEMLNDFPSILKEISEASTIFGIPENFVRNKELKSILHMKFLEYCLKNELKEVLFLYLDHHGLYPALQDLKDMNIDLSEFSWFSLLLSLRDLHKDEFDWIDVSLSNAAAVFPESEKSTTLQLCKEKPVIVLATILMCSLNTEKIFHQSEIHKEFNVNKTLLEDSLTPFEMLHSAIFSCFEIDETRLTSMYNLLQDNTRFNADCFYNRQPGNAALEQSNHNFELPNFSSPELVHRYGLVIRVTYTYYLKQRRPAFAYLAYVRDNYDIVHAQHDRKKSAFKNAYWIAVENFDSDSIVCTCAVFLDFLKIDSWLLRVDTESANYIAKNLKVGSFRKSLMPQGKSLKNFIVTCLKRKKKGKKDMLKMLEESVQNALSETNIQRTNFDAIKFWRIPMQFSKMNKLTPPVTFIKECAENGKWFHVIMFLQVYQLEPVQVLGCLEQYLKNAVLREHLLAVVKNAKISSSEDMEKKLSEHKLPKKTVKVNQLSAKDFRAQFYFSLKKGMESKFGDDKVRHTTSSSKNHKSSPEQIKICKQQQVADDEMSDTYENGKRLASGMNGGMISAFQVTNNVLDVMQECEESNYPCRELMSCAFSLSQPLFVVLAACYKNSDSVDCFCAWLILSFQEEKRFEILNKFNDIKQEKYQWPIESLLIILSDIINIEDNAAGIIAQGFRIFLEESRLLHFFLFYEAFMARGETDACIKHINTFAQELKDEIEEEIEANLVRSFFAERIPIKILLKCHSKFYQRKLLQYFMDAGFGSFNLSSSFSLEGINDICKATENTNIQLDLNKLSSDDELKFNEEKQRVYDLLLDNGYFEKASEFAVSFNLPTWKIDLFKITHQLESMRNSTLWQSEETRFNFWLKADDTFRMCDMRCSVAGSFFQNQANELEDLPFSERALLLSIAFRWFKNDTELENENCERSFLNLLEKQIWIFKIKSEIEKNSHKELHLDTDSSSANRMRNDSYSSSNLFSKDERTSSIRLMQHSYEACELIQPEEINFIETAEDPNNLLNETECKAFESLVGELLEKCEITQARRISAFFAKTVQDLEYVLSCIFLAQGTTQIENLDPCTASIISKSPGRSLSVSGTYDGTKLLTRSASFVESANSSGKIMSDWVIIEELQNTLEKLCSKCKKGRKCCERVLICFKIATMLGIDYSEAVRQEPFALLRELIYSGLDKRRQLCRQFIKAFDLSSSQVAAFIAEIIILWLRLNSNYEMTTLPVNQPAIMVENTFSSEDMINFIQLLDEPSILGMLILETAKSISQLENTEKDASSLQYQAELLIRAHDCFTIACNMEGISEVLRTARLCTLDLVKVQAYSSMVRILTGIGRFKEMTYVFHALAEEHHFELLFRKDIEKEKQLKAALLDYIKKNHADDKEKIDMLSKRFGMYREVGEQLEETAHKQINLIKDKIIGNKKGTEPALVEIAKTCSYAADNYLKVGCLRRSQQCRKLARLAELQIRLSASGNCILGLEKHKVNQLLCSHSDFFEAIAIADTYGFNSATTWVDPLYQIVIVKGDINYLKQYLSVFQLSGTVMMEIASRYRADRVNSQMGENLRKILSNVKEVKLRYKIAHELNLHDVIKNLLKGPSGALLRDTVFVYS